MTVYYPVLLGGIVIDDDNKVIRMTENATTANLTMIDPATGIAIPAGTSRTFFLLGDGSNDDLCRALKLTFESNANAVNPNTYTVTPTFSIDASTVAGAVAVSQVGGSTFALLFGNAATTFDESLIGFSGDTALSTATKTSTLSPGAIWVSPEVHRSLEPDESYDASIVRAEGGQASVTRTGGPFKDKKLEIRMVDSRRALRDDNTADPDATFAKFLERHGDGPRLRILLMPISSAFALDRASSVESGAGFYFDEETLTRFAPSRQNPGIALYDWDIGLVGYVA